MSEEMVSNTDTIYIELKDEGTEVYRPTQGRARGEGIYEVLPTPDYDSNDESWAFLPGSIVKCQEVEKNGQLILVAKSLA